MPLFDLSIWPYLKKVINSLSLKELMVDYFVNYLESYFARVYQGQGIFEGANVLTSTAPDTFSFQDTGPVNGDVKGIDGYGKEVDLEDDDYALLHAVACRLVPFENTNAQVYQLGMRPQQIPKSDDVSFPALEVNPITGEPQYSAYQDVTGELGEPDDVSWDGVAGELTVEVDAVVGDTLSWKDRWCMVYLNNPVSIINTVALGYGQLIYSGGKNKLVISNDLGQTAAGLTVSEVTSDYTVYIPGITVHKAALSATDYCFLGTVTGNGAGNTPTVFSVSGQRRLDLPFGDNAANIMTLGKDVYGDPLYASALIGTGAAYFNSPVKTWFETEHRAHDYVTPGERLTHGDIKPDSVAVKQKAGANKITVRALNAGDTSLAKIAVLKHDTGAYLGGLLGTGSLHSNISMIVGDRTLPGTRPQMVPLAADKVAGFTDDNLTDLPMSAAADAKNDLSELPETGLVGSVAGNYRRRLTITVGDGVTTFGDYNGATTIKTAIESFAGSEIAGHVHIKYGDYSVTNSLSPSTNGPINVPSNVLITGEGKGTRLKHTISGPLFKIDGEVAGYDGQIPDGFDLTKFYSALATFQTDGVREGDYLLVYYRVDGALVLTQSYKNFGAYRIDSIADENTLHVGPGRQFSEIDLSAEIWFAVARNGVAIKNLWLQGGSGAGNLIQANRSHACQFSDLYLRRQTNADGVYIANSFNTQVSNINAQNKKYAVSIYESCGTNVSNVSATACTAAVSLYSVLLPDHSDISNINAVKCTYAIRVVSGTGTNIDNVNGVRCTNDTFNIASLENGNLSNLSAYECGRRGLTVDGCIDLNISNVNVDDTQYGSGGYTGIYINGGENIRFTNCVVNDAYHGYYVDSSSFDVVFTNCKAKDNSRDGFHIEAPDVRMTSCDSFGNAGDGIDYAYGADNPVITGGRVEDNGENGIEMGGRHGTITGVQIKQNTTNGIWAETHTIINGCMVYDNGQDGIYGYHRIYVIGCTCIYNDRDGVRVGSTHSSIKSSAIISNGAVGINFYSGDNSVVGNDLRGNVTSSFAHNGNTGNGLNAGGGNNVGIYNEI